MLLFVALFLVLLVILITPSTERFAQQKILGGSAAGFDQYPWFAQIMGPDKKPRQGGALIAPDVVITCAHVTAFSLPTPGSWIRVGGDDWIQVMEVIANHRFYFEESYEGASNDLALVRLVRPSKKPPIRLATSMPAPNETVRVMGTGLDHEGVVYEPSRFSQAKLTYVTGPQAVKLLNMEPPDVFGTVETTNNIKNAMVNTSIITCVSSAKAATCVGDSGGPLIAKRGAGFELVGIVHGGHGCKKGVKLNHHYFSFFVNIPRMAGWIRARLNEHNYSIRGMQDAGCAYVGRARMARGGWRCPKEFPWDAGVWDQGRNVTPAGLLGKQCAKNSLCGIYMNNAYARAGAKTNPVRKV